MYDEWVSVITFGKASERNNVANLINEKIMLN